MVLLTHRDKNLHVEEMWPETKHTVSLRINAYFSNDDQIDSYQNLTVRWS